MEPTTSELCRTTNLNLLKTWFHFISASNQSLREFVLECLWLFRLSHCHGSRQRSHGAASKWWLCCGLRIEQWWTVQSSSFGWKSCLQPDFCRCQWIQSYFNKPVTYHIHKSHFGRMNLHKSQMLSCEQKGTRVLIHQVIITRYFSKMMALLWPLDWMTKGNVTFHLWTPQGRTLKSLQAMYIRYCSEMTAVQ